MQNPRTHIANEDLSPAFQIPLPDVASFYLSYLEVAIAAEADIRILCLRRPRETQGCLATVA